MRGSTAKKIKKIAKRFVIQYNKPLDSIQAEYKKLKKIYKLSKGQL